MRNKIVGLLFTVALFSLPAAAQTLNPLMRDKTGIKWVLPFKEAQAKAAKEQRLLMLKGVAFGTSADGGW